MVVADGRAWVQRGDDKLAVVAPDGGTDPVDLGAEPHAWAQGGGRVWVNAGHEVFAIDARSRRRATEAVDVGGIAADVVPRGSVVWVRTLGDRILRIDARSGRPIGRPVVLRARQLVADDEAAYVVSAGTAHIDRITRIDARTGATRTRTLYPSEDHSASSDVAVGGGYVWIGRGRKRDPENSEHGLLARIDPETLKPAGRPARVPSDAGGLTTAGGAIWATDDSGKLARVDAASGRARGRWWQVGAYPQLGTDGRTIYAAAAGRLDSFDARTGRRSGPSRRVGDRPGTVIPAADAIWVLNAPELEDEENPPDWHLHRVER